MQQLVAATKAFADPTRIRVLAALQAGELCVCELCDALQVPQSTLSTHLQVIRDSGLVQTRKEGKWIYYALDPDKAVLTDSIFTFFGPSLSRDKTLSADKSRLRARLIRREGGECCVGFQNAPRKKAATK
jgi:ArsR family transcriptional regulator, arsenate/arsenite/antimonite-responsive transcriptional repressor